MLIHIIGGSTALLSGAVSLSLRKGSKRHGKSGIWFVASMLVLASTGAVIAVTRVERGTAVIGVLTCYLVVTAWAAARDRSGTAGRLEAMALPVALGCAAAMLTFGLVGTSSPTGKFDSLPAAFHFPFAALALIAAALDLNFILRRQLIGVQRTARHLWRMCAALFIAAMSFFLGQQDEFPRALQGPVWFVPPLAVLAAMIFWIVRVRFTKAFAWVPPRIGPPPETAALGRSGTQMREARAIGLFSLRFPRPDAAGR